MAVDIQTWRPHRTAVVAARDLFTRSALGYLLRSEHNVTSIVEARDTAELAQLANRSTPDLLLVADDLPGERLESCLRNIRARTSSPRIIVIGEPNATRRHGPDVTIGRDSSVLHLSRAVRLAFADVPSSATELSARHVEVLRHVAMGESNGEIARDLSISVATVKRHLADIYRRLGAESRIDALRRAAEMGYPVRLFEEPSAGRGRLRSNRPLDISLPSGGGHLSGDRVVTGGRSA